MHNATYSLGHHVKHHDANEKEEIDPIIDRKEDAEYYDEQQNLSVRNTADERMSGKVFEAPHHAIYFRLVLARESLPFAGSPTFVVREEGGGGGEGAMGKASRQRREAAGTIRPDWSISEEAI